MIDLVWNFPLLVGQNEEWKGYLRRAVEGMQADDARELRPSFRGCDAGLRERAGKWLGVDAARAWIVCGGHHGTLVSLLAAGMAGKAIAVEAITYAGILEQSRMLGVRVLGCAYDDEGMLPDALREACAGGEVRAVFLMPTVHNPLGIVAGLERRLALVEVAREFDLVMIEDDAYGYMEPEAAANYAVLAPERTFYVRGLSKSYAPATRTGFVIAPERYAAAMESAIKNTSTGTSLVHNAASLLVIEDGTMDRVMDAKRAEGEVRNALGREIMGDAVGPGARFAWHLWVSLPEGLSAAEAQRVCLERGVMVSGAAGFTAPGSEVPGALRVGMGGEVERGRVEEGLRIVAGVLGW
jgi:DNA-binding transcriptional MocR family regulator